MGKRIHIVEDDAAIRDSLKLFLEIHGFQVVTFGSGEELLGGDQDSCDCYIFDVNLPGDDGFEVLAKLRVRGIKTPAIFMSGRATHTTRTNAAQMNAVAFFDKPVPPKEVLAAVTKATGA